MRQYQILSFFCAVCMFISCSKMDDFTQYIDGKEKIYPATMDSTIIRSGKNRVQIEGSFSVSSGVSAVIAYWNNRQDSMRYPINSLASKEKVKILVNNLPEGPINFEVRTVDDKGNISVPQYLSGNVYGDRYREGLLQRAILGHAFLEDKLLEIALQNVSQGVGFDAMRVKYKDVNGKLLDTVVKTKLQDSKLVLPRYALAENISYQTVFRPDTLSIDTFMVSANNFIPKGDITGWLLKNYKKPFYSSDYDGGRWGTLGDWNTNAAVKNHSGRGGYSSTDGGIIDLEAGWGSAAIWNGKIQQTVTLNPGKYVLSCENGWTTFGGNPPVNLVVSAPNAEIPDLENINQATAYGNVYAGGVTFELTERKVVNIGLLININPDNIYRLHAFKIELK